MNCEISGTKANIASSQLLISTGIPTLDALLGGGVPVGSIILINEDTNGTYSKVMLKYFIAEAVVSKQASLTISLDCDPKKEFIHNLPSLRDSDTNTKQMTNKSTDEGIENEEIMKIAFRYQNLPTREKEVEHKFGHYYDLSLTMDTNDINSDLHTCLSEDDIEKVHCQKEIFKNKPYNVIVNHLIEVIGDPRFSANGDELDLSKKTILRVNIHRLGSIMWGNLDELPKFLYYIRCLMRQAFAIAYITIPVEITQKLKEIYERRLLNIGDIALSLLSFSGTHYEKNKYLAEFHGFFSVDKLAPINSLVSPHPGSIEYTFKLLRKKFCIEKLCLPPGFDDSSDNTSKKKSHGIMSGCGTSKTSLDF